MQEGNQEVCLVKVLRKDNQVSPVSLIELFYLKSLEFFFFSSRRDVWLFWGFFWVFFFFLLLLFCCCIIIITIIITIIIIIIIRNPVLNANRVNPC